MQITTYVTISVASRMLGYKSRSSVEKLFADDKLMAHWICKGDPSQIRLISTQAIQQIIDERRLAKENNGFLGWTNKATMLVYKAFTAPSKEYKLELQKLISDTYTWNDPITSTKQLEKILKKSYLNDNSFSPKDTIPADVQQHLDDAQATINWNELAIFWANELSLELR